MRLKLTSKAVASLDSGNTLQLLVYDTQLPGFGVRVGRTRKAYFVERRVNGRTRRVSIERCDLMTCEQARHKAMKLLVEMSDGWDPTAEQRKERARSITLHDAFAEFLEVRPIKPSTEMLYRRTLNAAFKTWLSHRLVDISNEMVLRRFQDLTKSSGSGYANLAMRILRSVWNFARGRYTDKTGNSPIPENPVNVLSVTRSWNRLKPRQGRISNADLPRWYAAVRSLSLANDTKTAATVGDYLVFLLLTGARRSEAARLNWADVNLEERTFTLLDTKNGENLCLPMSDQINALISARWTRRTSEFVFPSRYVDRPLAECRQYLDRVRNISGVNFTLHDLRRTFLTLAEGLDIPHYALKRLVNHKLSGDVTAGYIIADPERLRAPMQLISNRITKLLNAE